MNDSSGPRNARRWGECHVFSKMVLSLCGMPGPHRSVFVPVEFLKRISHESGCGPSVAQFRSTMLLPRSKSCRGAGKLRLHLVLGDVG